MLKNVQEDKTYDGGIDYNMPKRLKFQKDKNGEVHFDILENVVFPSGSISRVFFILGQWIGDVNMDDVDEDNDQSSDDEKPLSLFQKNVAISTNDTNDKSPTITKKRKIMKRKRLELTKKTGTSVRKKKRKIVETDI